MAPDDRAASGTTGPVDPTQRDVDAGHLHRRRRTTLRGAQSRPDEAIVVAFLAICAEFMGGLGLIVGFLSRIAAFGIVCVMLVAIFRVHLVNGFFMNWAGDQKGEGFEFHILAIGIGLSILIRGAGALSLDRALSRR